MNLLDKYKFRQAQAIRLTVAEERAPIVNLSKRRMNAEDLAYIKVYETWFDEPYPGHEDPRDACITRAWVDIYDENDVPRHANSPSFEELNLAIEQAAREFGHTILYHDEFITWFAHDISECDLQAEEVKAKLEKLRPQFTDAYDVEFIINLLDAALAKPPQRPDGLTDFFAPNAPPQLHRLQLKRARKWALNELQRYKSTPIEAPIKVVEKRAIQARPELTLDSYLIAAHYSRKQLDDLLLRIGLVEKLPSGQILAALSQKAWQWAVVRAALESQFLLQNVSNARAASLFTQAYGAEVKEGTMRYKPDLEGHGRKSTQSIYFIKVISLLPKPIDNQ